MAFKVLAAAAALAAAVCGPAMAAPGSTLVPDGTLRNFTPTAGVAHKPISFYVNQAAGISLAVSSFTPVDAATTVKCNQTKGCTLVMTNFIQVTASPNTVAVSMCTMVDGAPAQGCGNFLGQAEPALGYHGFSDEELAPISYGTHTVQTYIDMTSTGTVHAWQFNYALTTP